MSTVPPAAALLLELVLLVLLLLLLQPAAATAIAAKAAMAVVRLTFLPLIDEVPLPRSAPGDPVWAHHPRRPEVAGLARSYGGRPPQAVDSGPGSGAGRVSP
jgi:hypothetical protein